MKTPTQLHDTQLDLEKGVTALNRGLFGIGKAVLSYADLFRGTQIFGSTGSGKTTGSGRAIAKSLLKNGFGGLVLCVKSDEASIWESYLKEANRESDLIRVAVGEELAFNFLDDQQKEGEDLHLPNITGLLQDVHTLYNRGSTKVAQDHFWSNQLQSLLNHAFVITRYRDSTITIRGLVATVRGAVDAYTDGSRSTHSLAENEFTSLIDTILDAETNQSIVDACQYFRNEFASLAEKTRSIIVAMFLSVAEPLMQKPLESLFCSRTTVTPNDAFDGKIIVIDVPVHTYGRVGLLTQLIWKLAFKMAVKSRPNNSKPVFLWADESQYFVEDSDIEFLTTTRSKRCAVVYLTQNISNYEASLDSPNKAQAILGSLNTRIFHQNNCYKTNELATRSIGKKKVSSDPSFTDTMASFISNDQPTLRHGKDTKWEDEVPQNVFSKLRSGGKRNRFIVEAILHVPGARFKAKNNWLKIKFNQNH